MRAVRPNISFEFAVFGWHFSLCIAKHNHFIGWKTLPNISHEAGLSWSERHFLSHYPIIPVSCHLVNLTASHSCPQWPVRRRCRWFFPRNIQSNWCNHVDCSKSWNHCIVTDGWTGSIQDSVQDKTSARLFLWKKERTINTEIFNSRWWGGEGWGGVWWYCDGIYDESYIHYQIYNKSSLLPSKCSWHLKATRLLFVTFNPHPVVSMPTTPVLLCVAI